MITSTQFRFGEQNSRCERPYPIQVGLSAAPRDFSNASDATRVNAKFLVLHTMVEGDVVIQPSENDYWTRIYAKRLNNDGTFDAAGEVITFANGIGGSVEEVTIVGRMQLTYHPLP